MAIINWKDVNQAYPETAKLADATQADSSHVLYGIAELESALATRYTVPFSTNNLTAKELAVDFVYARLYRFKDTKKFEAAKKSLDDRIKALREGRAAMVLSDGTTLESVGGTVYSTTDGYTPVFGMSPTEYSQVDSSQVYDEEVARGNIP